MSKIISYTNENKEIQPLIDTISDKKNSNNFETVDGLVYDLYCEYLKTGKYPYLDSVVMFILPKIPQITTEQQKILHTQVYNAAAKYDENRRIAFRKEKLKEGWLLLTEEICRQAVASKSKLEVLGKLQTDWLSQTVNKVFKPVIGGEDGKTIFLMPPKARTKGLPLWKLLNNGESDCFCKIV
jgi:hypothetical protein